MVLSTAFRRYEYLDSLFNAWVIRLEKEGINYPNYVIYFSLDKGDVPKKIDTKKDFEKLIGWRDE
jgi:hypothetical protein